MQADLKWRKTVCPVWMYRSGTPELIGCTTLMRIAGASFALTAAHVIEEFGTDRIFFGCRHGFRPFVGEINTSVIPDKSDTAFLRLHEEIADWLAEDFTFLSVSDFQLGDLPVAGTRYTFLGSPYRKAKKRGKLFHFPVYSIVSDSVSPEIYRSMSLAEASHVVVRFDARRMCDESGRSVTAPNPQGMSGGPVFASYSRISDEDAAAGRLVAVIIEHHLSERVLVGVRIGCLAAAIKRAYPELSPLIPNLPPWLIYG